MEVPPGAKARYEGMPGAVGVALPMASHLSKRYYLILQPGDGSSEC